MVKSLSYRARTQSKQTKCCWGNIARFINQIESHRPTPASLSRPRDEESSGCEKGIENMEVETNHMVLRLLAAITAAEDRLCELSPRPEDDAVILLLRSAMLEAERSFQEMRYARREFPHALSA
jgi:hypothetical protein